MLRIRSTACIVGNSVSLKGSALGEKIDGHQHVVRCNFFEIKGYEKDVGTKTTHWLIAASVAMMSQICEWGDCSSFNEVWVRHSVKHKDAVVQVLNDVKIYRWIKSGLSPVVGDWTKTLCKPTTGLVGIVYALSQYPLPLNIAGFGTSGFIDPSHYEPKRTPSWSSHDLDAERILINHWVKEGIVRRMEENHY